MFFSDELSRLFKVPTVGPIMTLASKLLDAYEFIEKHPDSDNVFATIPLWALPTLESILETCRAMRSIGCPIPFPDGNKAARAVFAAKKGSVSDAVQSVVNAARASRAWEKLINPYWGESMNDDRLAEDFAEINETLQHATVAKDYGVVAASIDKTSFMQALTMSTRVRNFSDNVWSTSRALGLVGLANRNLGSLGPSGTHRWPDAFPPDQKTILPR
jgi:hypothetical protein